MLGDNLIVNSYVVIGEGCPVAMSINKDEQVHVTCGKMGTHEFEFILEAEALRAFVELGTDALEEIDRVRSRCVG